MAQPPRSKTDQIRALADSAEAKNADAEPDTREVLEGIEDEITGMHRTIEKVADAVRAPQPSAPQILAVPFPPPPVSESQRPGGRTKNLLYGIAAVITALSGAGITQCAHDAAQAVPHRAPPVASTHP